jgi:hypothetical protein
MLPRTTATSGERDSDVVVQEQIAAEPPLEEVNRSKLSLVGIARGS